MKIISLNGPTKPLGNTCAAIGIFDGVHLGHQFLIKQMMRFARRHHLKPIVITFFPHPAHVLPASEPQDDEKRLKYIISLDERFRRLKSMGVEVCVVVPFSPSFAKIKPEAFIKDTLVKQLGVKAIFTGENFRFGKNRSGDSALFKRLEKRYGYQMHAIAQVKKNGTVISSTRIRHLIAQGKLSQARGLLGNRVQTFGKVVKGSRRGKGLGFPTANIDCRFGDPSSVLLLPPQGVYVVRALIGTKNYQALANIGTRPTFEAENLKLFLEVHILDFAKNIYGKYLTVEFLKKIRNEKKFSSPQQLIRQIRKDQALAMKYFQAH